MSTLILDHPIAKDAMTHLRDKQTSVRGFRDHLQRLSLILASLATEQLPTVRTQVTTPLAPADTEIISGQQALVPVMRAGHGMLDAFLQLMPESLIWHLSMSRAHEPPFDPIFTDSKVPKQIPEGVHTCFVLDPMLATAGSACFAIQHLKERGAQKVVFVGVLGAEQGLKRLQDTHPDVDIFMGAIDAVLNDAAYIVPGLGDAGDRIYPTV